ncbi:MAG TPA: PTS sugar transporter subunit IIA [Candidatus Krumholzibacteria bacterium]|nr:PTS sugar transporter subunit IIA [Candidatus Krumholzibacteria bacterium]HPD72225.1 PTS sugar transporter subunit IIA [Candidatus Krumholzibacteria bacterium]HRY40843.1 PTS sugar transporter subunit IIA [Candidatus Krumholzibacteria bacterium]
MQIGVREAARLLTVSEKTIYRWIKDGRLPAYLINEQYRFNKAELLEWATGRKINVSPQIFEEPPDADRVTLPAVSEALEAGGIHYRVAGKDTSAVLMAIVELMRLPDEVDRTFLHQVLLARESLGSTGVGDGIAIPHVRNPIVLHVPRPTVTLCFLERPIDFGAIDGKPVSTLFTIVSPAVRAHLHILSRLVFILRDLTLRDQLARQASRDEILATVRRAEARAVTEPPAAPREAP